MDELIFLKMVLALTNNKMKTMGGMNMFNHDIKQFFENTGVMYLTWYVLK